MRHHTPEAVKAMAYHCALMTILAIAAMGYTVSLIMEKIYSMVTL